MVHCPSRVVKAALLLACVVAVRLNLALALTELDSAAHFSSGIELHAAAGLRSAAGLDDSQAAASKSLSAAAEAEEHDDLVHDDDDAFLEEAEQLESETEAEINWDDVPGINKLIKDAKKWVEGQVKSEINGWINNWESKYTSNFDSQKKFYEAALVWAKTTAEDSAKQKIDAAAGSVTAVQSKINAVQSDTQADLQMAKNELAALETATKQFVTMITSFFKSPLDLTPDASCALPAFFTEVDNILNTVAGMKPLTHFPQGWCYIVKFAEQVKIKAVLDKLTSTQPSLFKAGSFVELEEVAASELSHEAKLRAVAEGINWNHWYTAVETLEGVADLLQSLLSYVDAVEVSTTANGAPSPTPTQKGPQDYIVVFAALVKITTSTMRAWGFYVGCPN